MAQAPAWLDYSVVVFFLAILIGLGWYYRRGQRSAGDYFLAARSLGAFPIGLSLMTTCIAVWGYAGIPGDAYAAGFRLLIIPLALWCCLPLLTRVVLPLYYRLGITSVYDYLELRYDAPTRRVATMLFVLWRLVWLSALVYVPYQVLAVWGGVPLSAWGWLAVIGAVTTLYALLGGMQAVIWSTVFQACVMAVGVALIIITIWMQLEGGAARVTEVARALGRMQFAGGAAGPRAAWEVWAGIPHFVLVLLALFVADQLTAQRYLAARTLAQAQWSVTWSCVGVTILVGALSYAGVALLAFYHDHPETMRPIWVANVDHQTHQSICDQRGVPLLGWSAGAITPENIDQLVADRRLLRPNTYEPLLNTDGLVLVEGGVERINIRQLAMRRPPPEGLGQGEFILNERARPELWPHFLVSQTARGVTGWLLAAVLAASMSCIGAGLHAIATLGVIDQQRRQGVRHDGTAGPSVAAGAVRSARRRVAILGLVVTLLALAIARWDAQLVRVVQVLSALAGPLLAVFLLGMVTRRATAAAALTTLLAGAIFTGVWAAVGAGTSAAGPWFGQPQFTVLGPFTGGVIFSLVWGFLMSFLLGCRKERTALRGLVLGQGDWGVREPEEASIAIPDSFE